MSACDYCGSTILFGGKTAGSLRFCNDQCARNGEAMVKATSIPHDQLEKAMRAIHLGNCPKCGGPGPVDVHTCHKIASFLFVTKWSSKPVACCRRCGLKSQLGGLLSSLLLGWWGFPWGLVMTPIQIARNLSAMVWAPDPQAPSPALEKMVRLRIASKNAPGAFLRRASGAPPSVEGMDHRFG